MNRKELLNKLNHLSAALAKDDLIPVLKCFMFDGENVTAYNDKIAIIAPCPVDEAFAVNGDTLLGLLSNLSGDEVEFAVKDDVVVSSGKSVFNLPYFQKDDFIFETPADPAAAKVSLTPEALEALENCLDTVSNDLAQPALMGVTLHKGAFYSCNGDALTKSVFAKGKHSQHTIPSQFCSAVLDIIGDDSAKEISIDEHWAKAVIGEFTIYGRMIVIEDQADYEELINASLANEHVFVPKPEGLTEALSRARVIADKESTKTTVEISKGRVKMHTANHLGEVDDVLAIDKKHPNVATAVSAEVVQKALVKTGEIAIMQGCCAFKKGEGLLIITGNME